MDLNADRLKRAIASFIFELFPTLDFYRPHLYQVVSWDDSAQAADLAPAAATTGMPALSKVAWRGLGMVTLPEGMEVVVWFDNGDPTRPFIGVVGQPSSAGSQADDIDLSQSDQIHPFSALVSRRVVRYGDTIMMPLGAAGTPTPTIVAGNPLNATASFSRVKA